MGLESLMSEIHDRREETDRLSEQLDVQRQHFKQVIIIMTLDQPHELSKSYYSNIVCIICYMISF